MPAQWPKGRSFHPGPFGPGGPGSDKSDLDNACRIRRPGFKFTSPRFTGSFVISGVTRNGDAAGVPLAGCQVELFRASDDVNLAGVVSDGSGNFSFTVASNSDTYFLAVFGPGNTQAGATVEGLIATPVGT